MKGFLFLICVALLSIAVVYSNEQYKDPKQMKGVTIVPESESESQEQQQTESSNNNQQENTVNINAPNDLKIDTDTMNPQLLQALREINDDPTYLKQQQDGELVDLNQYEMDPQKYEEMIEIFDWIESQLPPDDPQQIQNILNRIDKHIKNIENPTNASISSNYTVNHLLNDLIILPEFLYQVDNGVDFMKMNGIPILLATYNMYNPLNDENILNYYGKNNTLNYKLISQIMDAIGVSCQNNPGAIQYTHQHNLVSFLIDELNNIYLKYKNEHIPLNGQLMNKLIFTLSSITRQSDVGLQHLESKNGQKILYKNGKMLSKEINNNDSNEDDENNKNIGRAYKKLLRMISDIVVLNRNRLEYSKMFLKNKKWCGFMVEKGLLYEPDSVIQFINYGIERNFCTGNKLINSLKNKLKIIVEQNTYNDDEDNDDDEYHDDGLLTQANNMLKYIEENFKYHNDNDKKTEL